MALAERWSLVEEADFFSGLEEERARFMALARRREYQKGAMVFFEEDPGGSCYYLEQGIVKIFKISHTGKEPIYFIRRHGAVFGLAEVIDAKPRNSNAQTLAESVIWEIDKRDFELLLEQYSRFARSIISVLGKRIRYLGNQIENLMVCDVVTRIAKLIAYLAYDTIIKEEDWERPVIIRKRLTQEQMASMTGSCQQTVSEVLKALQQEGLLQIKRSEIIVLNPLQLLRKAELH